MTGSAPSTGKGDLGSQALEIAKRRQAAANEVLALLRERLGENLPHPETALFAASWLAGTSLYRSLNLPHDIPPGTPVLSTQANEKGPQLLSAFAALLGRLGVVLKQGDVVIKIPDEHRAQSTILEIQSMLQKPYNEIMRKYGFDYFEGAKTGAVACALLTKALCAESHAIEPGLAAGIVSMGFVEGSKTAPAPMEADGDPPEAMGEKKHP